MRTIVCLLSLSVVGAFDAKTHCCDLRSIRTEQIREFLMIADDKNRSICEDACIGVIDDRIELETSVAGRLDPGLATVATVQYLSVSPGTTAGCD